MSTQTRAEDQTLALSPEAIRAAAPALKLYEAAQRPSGLSLRAALKIAWTAGGLCGLLAFAWAEPWSAKLLPSYLMPLVLAIRGVLAVEAFGYAYHRFFQHLGFFTRKSQVFRRNQMFHWMHHMIIYPIGRHYRRPGNYVSSEGGLGLSWVVPGLIAGAVAFLTLGVHLGTFVFVGSIASYAYFFVDDIHSRFHLIKHSYQGSRYYQWLEDIHVLHHWDQRMNFTICHPLMDMLFGTYLSPASHRRELEIALADMELTVSDLINWRYLLTEATPAEYAAFISQARRHPRSLRKVGHLMEVLHHRMTAFPADADARLLRQRAVELLNVVQA